MKTPRLAGEHAPKRHSRSLVNIDMAKNSKSKSTEAAENSELIVAVQRIAIQLGLVLLFLSVSATGLFFLKRYVERRLAFTPAPPKIVLKDRPAWMSDAVFDQI